MAVTASEVLEGLFTDSCEVMDLRIMETLERHRECHLFEVFTDVMVHHQ